MGPRSFPQNGSAGQCGDSACEHTTLDQAMCKRRATTLEESGQLRMAFTLSGPPGAEAQPCTTRGPHISTRQAAETSGPLTTTWCGVTAGSNGSKTRRTDTGREEGLAIGKAQGIEIILDRSYMQCGKKDNSDGQWMHRYAWRRKQARFCDHGKQRTDVATMSNARTDCTCACVFSTSLDARRNASGCHPVPHEKNMFHDGRQTPSVTTTGHGTPYTRRTNEFALVPLGRSALTVQTRAHARAHGPYSRPATHDRPSGVFEFPKTTGCWSR